MKYFILSLFSLFLFTSQANAWVIEADFENGTVGSSADGNDGFSDAFLRTKYTDAVVHSGSQAAIVQTKSGDDAFGVWGGTFHFPTDLKEGDELWYRVWVYFPVGFPWNNVAKGEGLKFMRIRTEGGYLHNYTRGESSNSGKFIVGSEIHGPEFFENNGPSPYDKLRNIGEPINSGKWYAFEQYIKFSNTPGKAVRREWQNGNLVFEDTITATLKYSNSTSPFAYLWSYYSWGGDATAYADDILLTNENPGNVDAHGNPFIGVGNATFTAAPKAPSPFSATKN